MQKSITIRKLFRGYHPPYGAEILYDSSRKLAYACILKNAHTWASQLFIDNLNCEKISIVPTKTKTVVILRHPIARWISGFSEFLSNYDEDCIPLLDNINFRKIIFDTVQWDDHTARQIDSVISLDIKDCLFFRCNTDLEENLIQFISLVKETSIDNIINNKRYNRADDSFNSAKPILNRKITELVNSNIEYRKKLLDFYEFDMKLLSYVNQNNLWYSPDTNT